MNKSKKIKLENGTLRYDNVMVREYRIEEVDDVFRPAAYGDKPELGEVMMVGTGRVFDNGTIQKLTLKVGDLVYFNKYSSVKLNIDGQDVYIIKDEDIMWQS